MGRSLNEVVASLPEARRARIEARAQELVEEVQSLRELRRAAGKAQTDVASALKIKQPSVSKIEQQADMYLSTLRSYVEAMGGELELTVRFPARQPIHLRSLGDFLPSEKRPALRRKRATAKR